MFACALSIRINVYLSIRKNVRLLLKGNESYSNGAKLAANLTNKDDDSSNNQGYSICVTKDGAEIVSRYSPCILYLENLDMILHSNLTKSNDQLNTTENFQDQFAVTLEKFLDNLWPEVLNASNQSISTNESQGYNSLSHILLQNMVIVVSCTRSINRLSQSMRNIFTQEIVFGIPNQVDLLKYTARFRFSNVENSDDICHNIVEAATTISATGGNNHTSFSLLRDVSGEVVNQCLQRQNAIDWFVDTGLLPINYSQVPHSRSNNQYINRLSFCTNQDERNNIQSRTITSPVEINGNDVKNAVKHLSKNSIFPDGTDGNHTSQVAPVKWEDIGGLDR